MLKILDLVARSAVGSASLLSWLTVVPIVLSPLYGPRIARGETPEAIAPIVEGIDPASPASIEETIPPVSQLQPPAEETTPPESRPAETPETPPVSPVPPPAEETTPPESRPAETPETPAIPTPTPNAEEKPDAEEARVLVAEVAVRGTSDRELENLVYNTIRTRPGRTTTRSRLQEDINAIYATGFFANVRVIP